MGDKRFLTRKDLAEMLEVSVDTVRRNEPRWGLASCRINLNPRLVRYWRVSTLNALRRLGFIEPPR